MFDFYKHRQLSQAGSAGGGNGGGGTVVGTQLFHAFLSASTSDDVTGDGTLYQIIFDSVEFDQGSNFNTTTGTFTAPITGIYQFNANFLTTASVVAQNVSQFVLTTTTKQYQAPYINPATVNFNGLMGQQLTAITEMTAGDTATISVQLSNGAKTVGIFGDSTGTYTWFSGFMVPPNTNTGGGGSLTSVVGGTNITVNTVGTTATVNLDDIVSLTHADDGSTQGQLQFNGIPFLYNYGFHNAFVGEDSGNTTLTPGVGGAANNVGVGWLTLDSLTTGSANTAVGSASLHAITTGGSNVAIGTSALSLQSTGSNCTVVGAGAASLATNLLNSEVIGVNALVSYNYASPFTEHNMVAIGTGACQSITTAARDIFIGTRAGFQLQTSGFYNTCVGYQVSYQPTTMGTLNVIMGANSNIGATQYGSGNVILGANACESGVSVTIGDNNIVVGSSSGTGLNSSENSNILIANSGFSGDNGTIRIGSNGTHTTAYLQGIAGVSVSNTNMVTIDTTNGQLGSQTIPSPSSPISITAVSTTPYVVTTDYYMSVDTSSVAITIQLPNAPTTGTVYVVKDSTGNALVNNINVTTVGGVVTIDGSTTNTIIINYGSVTVVFNGTNYEIWQ